MRQSWCSLTNSSRVEDREVRAMARTIKAIGDVANISYLIALIGSGSLRR